MRRAIQPRRLDGKWFTHEGLEEKRLKMETGKGLHSGSEEHHQKSMDVSANIAIVTVSDSRTPETDINGKYLTQQIEQMGFQFSSYHLIHDEPAEISTLLDDLSKTDAQIILFNGGTGISKRDTTFDVISKKLEKVIPGFGEIFRMLSYEQVGPSAMFSRATAGIYQGKLVFSFPGSPAAVQLAWEKIISPEVKHLIWEISR